MFTRREYAIFHFKHFQMDDSTNQLFLETGKLKSTSLHKFSCGWSMVNLVVMFGLHESHVGLHEAS